APQPAVAAASASTPAPAAQPAQSPTPAPATAAAPVAQGTDNGRAPQTQTQPAQPPADMSAAVAAAMPQTPAETYSGQTAPPAPAGGAIESEEERLRKYSTPAVRRLAEEHNVDIGQVKGTG